MQIGLGRVRSLSERTLQRIVEEARLAPFDTLPDLLARVRPSVEEARDLIRVGACDGLGGNRAEMIWQLYACLPLLRKPERGGQCALPMEPAIPGDSLEIPPLPDYTLEERIALEREVLGLALSGHPLSCYTERLARYRPVSSTVLDAYVGEKVVVAGWPIGARPHRTQQGEWMVFLSLEDLAGTIEVVLFPAVYRSCSGALGSERPHVVQGLVQERQEELVVEAESLWLCESGTTCLGG